jgi:hypothetical protein
MSIKSEKLEMDIEQICQLGNFQNINFTKIDKELIDLFDLNSSVKIISSQKIGNKSTQNKTDVLVKLSNGKKIKISIKLSNADYFGNWYGHNRALLEFGKEKVQKLIQATTDWANEVWLPNANASLFVGVSVSFGTRSGDTQKNFLDIFDADDVLKIIKGDLPEDHDETANVLYVSDSKPKDFQELLESLKVINKTNIQSQVQNFKVIFRPINPKTEESNRGKNIYTKFDSDTPKSSEKIIVQDLESLKELGKFVKVDLDKELALNHNKVLDDLFNNKNIVVPRKGYYYYYLEKNDIHVVYLDEKQELIHDIFKESDPIYNRISNYDFKKIKKRHYNDLE